MARIDLSGKPIAITGASSGIGAATAIECARAGMPVVLGARRVDKLEAVANIITAAGGRAATVAMDVTKPDDCRRLIDETVARFGSVYAVFANAGYGLEAPIAEMTDEAMRQIFETNFYGTLNTIAPALPRMLEARSGHILICSSCLAKMTLPYYGAYSATKAAQNHIGRAMNLELRHKGVHVSTVHPIGTRTEFFNTVQKLNGGIKIVEHTPDRFMQPPERVARAIVRCLRRPRPEVWTSRFVRLGMAFCNAFPGVEDRWIRWMLERRRRNLGLPED
jgi:short-subunit dehydrogenase